MHSDESIKNYCGNIRERLLACRSVKIAHALKERLCYELSLNCRSEMVNNVLRANVDQMISEIFDQDGKNRYLEVPNEKK
ncbi:hypothetical protein JW998_17270 [candidate division KSB1 bacterium]|nr:hypothetical protein [candidate division KSB1 bacterium]